MNKQSHIRLGIHLLKKKCISVACILLASLLLLASCHRESELEKVVRQANKRCPVTITDGMRLDSIVLKSFQPESYSQDPQGTLTYFVTLWGIYEEEWMMDVVEANLAGLDDRQASALLAQGLNDDPHFEKLLHDSDCKLSLILQYSDGRRVKSFDIDLQDAMNPSDVQNGTGNATMDIVRRDVKNSNAACPMLIADGIVMQSVVLVEPTVADKASNLQSDSLSHNPVITYTFIIGGDDLVPESVDRSMLEGLQAAIAADLESNPAMRIYRENNITIHYSFENNKGQLLYGFDF